VDAAKVVGCARKEGVGGRARGFRG